MRTYTGKPSDVEKRWYVVDLTGQTVGRAASQVASVLRGKHRPQYTPHADMGDYIIAINADKVVFTGKKWDHKYYYRHSGYPGGIKGESAAEKLARKPEEVFYLAVKGMMPKNPLGRSMLKKLKIYAGDQHPHDAQQPEPLSL